MSISPYILCRSGLRRYLLLDIDPFIVLFCVGRSYVNGNGIQGLRCKCVGHLWRREGERARPSNDRVQAKCEQELPPQDEGFKVISDWK